MDFETVDANEFGQSLTGVGVNLVSGDVGALVGLMVEALGCVAHRVSVDFAIVEFNGSLIQIHHDGTYHSHPLLGLLPENPPRGGGVQLYFFGADPDLAVEKVEALGGSVLEMPADKPHGLYEGTVLSAEGYAFSAAVHKKAQRAV